MSDSIHLDELLGHDPFVRRLAQTLLRDESDAADVAQEAWKNALEADAPAAQDPRGWLARIVRNTARMRRRGEARRDLRERTAARPEQLPSAAEIAQRESLRRDVVECVLSLSEPQRTAVLLRFYEGLPPRAIARRVGVPVETVRSRIRTGLERLKGDLDAHRPRATWMVGLMPFARRRAIESTGSGVLVAAAVAIVAVGAAVWLITRPGDDVSLAGPVTRAASAGSGGSSGSPSGLEPIQTDPFTANGVTVVSANEHDGAYPDCEPENADGTRLAWTATMVVDAVTGLPIEGVRVSAHIEPHCAIPDRWEPAREVKTGADGWARMRLDDLPDGDIDWWYYLADGYAPYAHFSTIMEFPIRLKRGVDVPIEVRDHEERPIEGAKVGLILGCGHTPNVRRVTTDEQGRAVIPCVTPDYGEMWPLKLGFESEYVDLGAWRPGWPALVVRMKPGAALIGQVTDHLSRPLPFAFVGVPSCHRGPWTRADERGRFELAGAGFGSEIYVRKADGEHANHAFVISGPVTSGIFRVIRATEDPDEVDELVGPLVDHTIDVVSEGRAVEDALVRLVRADDGMTFGGATGPGGDCRLECAPGRYRVLTRSPSEIEAWRKAPSTVVIQDGGERTRITMPPLRPVRFRLDGWNKPRYSSIAVVGDQALVEISTSEAMIVPRDRPIRLRVKLAGRSPRFIEVRPDAEGICNIPPASTRPITIELTRPDGAPAKGWIELLTRDWSTPHPARGDGEARTTFDAEAEVGHDQIIYATPADPALAPVAVDLRLDDGDPDRRVVTVAFELDVAPFSVKRPAWAGADEEAEITVLCDGITEKAIGRRIRDGYVRIPKGATIRARFPNGPGITVPLEGGDGPWTVAWPDTPVRFAVRNGAGDPVRQFEVFLGDHQWSGKDGEVTLHGLSKGRHTVHVAAPGMKSWTLELRVDDAKGGTVEVVMHPRG